MVYDTARGARNYAAMIAIPKFTSVQSTRSGLTYIKELKLEREAWDDAMDTITTLTAHCGLASAVQQGKQDSTYSSQG